MNRLTLLAAGAAVALAASPAHAIVCDSTITVANGGTVAASTLLASNACVAAGDKIFGEFATSGAITGNGSASFAFGGTPGATTLGFLGTVAPGSVGGITYTVAVDPVFAVQGWRIDGLEKDLTLNAAGAGPASATLDGTVDPVGVSLSCTRTANPPTSNCPGIVSFAPVSEITVDQTITTDVNAIVTALTDTVEQVQVRVVPEPGTLALLGAALLGLAVLRRQMRAGA